MFFEEFKLRPDWFGIAHYSLECLSLQKYVEGIVVGFPLECAVILIIITVVICQMSAIIHQ